MHSLLSAPLLVLLASLAAATSDISLSQFTPRINNLPTECKAVYTSTIDGCTASDFSSSATCSAQCVAGLTRIAASVKSGCRNVDVGETSIIGVFQNDIGVAALCPNNRPSPSSSASPSPAKSSPPSPTKSTLQTSSRASTPATTTAAPPTSTLQPSSTSSGLAIDTTSRASQSSFRFNSPTATPSSSSASAGNSQLSNSDSGGGSPFDVVATGGAGRGYGIECAAWGMLGVAAVAVWL